MNEDKFFKERLKNKFITVGLTTAAVLFVIANTVGDILSAFADSRGSMNRVIQRIDKYRHKSLSVEDYLEVLKEASGINLANTIVRLKRKGLILELGNVYALTPLGRQFVQKLRKQIYDRTHWDGKWRLITFDVPEKQRRNRDWLRGTLRLRGYRRLHRSVFLGKFPLPEEVYREIHKRGLVSFIHILTVGEIDDENKLF